MITVSSTEFSKNVGQYREISQREPVAITSHDRVTSVLLSSEEYEQYKLLKRKAAIEKLNADIQIGLDQAARGESIPLEEVKKEMAAFKQQFLKQHDQNR
jgi:PHD/YefM family antitoxin component YafN of YafNO toxin-antitoxin module